MQTPKFKVGDKVKTGFSGQFTEHVITKVHAQRFSGSGVTYEVTPEINYAVVSETDEAWFEPANEEQTRE